MNSVETSLYYLVTRFYDPSIGRFISADDISYLDSSSIGGLNLYAYCGSNPIMRWDPFGCAWWHWAVGAAIVVGLAALTVITAGGFAAAYGAVILTSAGIASTSLAVTMSSFALVGAAAVFSTYAIAAAGYAITSSIIGNSLSSTLNTIGADGEEAMWATAGGGVVGMVGGYLAHREQYPNSHYKILKVGKMDGVRANPGYPGIRYRTPGGQIRSIEIHPPHQQHGIHLQRNTWWLNKAGYEGQYYRAFGKHFEIFKFWKGWF